MASAMSLAVGSRRNCWTSSARSADRIP
jgi:hypothetical protein